MKKRAVSWRAGALILALWLALLAPATVSMAEPAGPRLARTAYTSEAAFLSDLAALGITVAHEGFEDDAAWGAVRSTVAGGTHTAPSITNLGVTWTANNPVSQVTTGPGPARTGSWGFFTLPHGNPASGMPDGWITSGDLVAAGGWVETNTPPAGIKLVIDGDEANPIDFDGNNVLGAQYRFFGVIDPAGFSTVEFRETEAEGDDWKFIFGDDFTFGVAACVASPDVTGDGTVDLLDIQAIASDWQQALGCPVDQDGDGEITIVDVQVVCAAAFP